VTDGVASATSGGRQKIVLVPEGMLSIQDTVGPHFYHLSRTLASGPGISSLSPASRPSSIKPSFEMLGQECRDIGAGRFGHREFFFRGPIFRPRGRQASHARMRVAGP
jgi:hypothetical protein